MKMNSMNISLPPAMAEFVRQTIERDYGNASEFFRSLVRERIQRDVESDVAFLNEATDHAPAGPDEQDIADVLSIQRRIRKAILARGV
jgi:Arc/MetJ-type ribon-helix-helix transcriptional regulator